MRRQCPNVGEKTSSDLANRFGSFENLRNAKIEELLEVENIGDITVEGIENFFNEEHIKDGLDRLLSKGITFKEAEQSKGTNLNGLTIVVTGTIEGYNRKEIENELKLRGAKVSGSVSKNTDILLAGESAGSKLEKARSFDTKIYEGNDLYEFLEENLRGNNE